MTSIELVPEKKNSVFEKIRSDVIDLITLYYLNIRNNERRRHLISNYVNCAESV